jgi:predicted RNase H-like nuclease
VNVAGAAVGVDACKAGWVAVVVRDGELAEAHVLGHVGELVAAVGDAGTIAIDIPIGLVDTGKRDADRMVRAALGVRRNSLFVTPVRAALEAATYAEALEISRRVANVGISAQAFALRSKILEVERWIPAAPCRVAEVHPELCFAEMTGAPMAAGKRSWQGMIDRRAALASQGIVLDDVDRVVGARVPVDDLLDAAAAAWTALRLLAGAARCLPDPPQTGGGGASIAIWV